MSVPAYRQLFWSAAIVIFGVMGQAVARGWLAKELTGSNAGLGGVMLVFGLSMLVATPAGGVAADRYPKRTVLLAAVLALMTSSLLLGAAVITGVIAYWMLLVTSGVQAAAFAFYLPARIAYISEVVPGAMIQNAIVVAQMAQEGMRVVAPALAGVLIGVSWFGVGGVFVGAGVASGVAAAFVFGLPNLPPRDVERQSPVRELADAARYLRRTPGLGVIALLTVGVVMVGFPYLTFLPTLADDRYGVGATGFGIMSGVAGLGALVAGFLDASFNGGTRPWRTIGFAGLAFGASLAVLGLAETYEVALVALFAVGASGLVFQTSTQSLMLRLSALEYHGRLQSMVILGFSGFGLAALPLGLLADAITLRWTFAGMGGLIVVMTGGFVIVRLRARRIGPAVEFG